MIPSVEVFSNTLNSVRKDITMAIRPQRRLFGWKDVEELGIKINDDFRGA